MNVCLELGLLHRNLLLPQLCLLPLLLFCVLYCVHSQLLAKNLVIELLFELSLTAVCIIDLLPDLHICLLLAK